MQISEVRKKGLRNTMRNPVFRIFNDSAMAGFAVILAFTIFLPSLFHFSPLMLTLFEGISYIIVFIFLTEYLLKVYVAESRLSYIINSWHILDLIIILLALLDIFNFAFVPQIINDNGRLFLVLRLIPFALAFLLAGRTVERVIPEKPKADLKSPISNLIISTLDSQGIISKCSMAELKCFRSDDKPLWIDIQFITEKDIDFIKDAINIPRFILESKLIHESFPRIDFFKDFTTIFLWDSRNDNKNYDNENLNVVTNDMLIVCAENKILTLSTGMSDLFDRISSGEMFHENEEFAVKILYLILKTKMGDYGEIVRSIEEKTIKFEEIPVNETSPKFLEETFHFKNEIQKIISNLWHFKQVLDHIKVNKVALKGIGDDHYQIIDILFDGAEYMYETAQNTRDSLVSLIELHINMVSHDMNRVIKILAVITCLGLIPSIIGGLLGVNLMDVPYQLKITEVFFLVFSFMLIGTYVFYKLGWLK